MTKHKKGSRRQTAKQRNRGRETRPDDPHMGTIAQLIRAQGSGERRLVAGQDLFGPGTRSDAIYCLEDGWIFLYAILENGHRQILHFAMPGSILGVPAARATVTTFGAQALTDAVVTVLPYRTLRTLSTTYPDLAFDIARLVASDRDLAFGQLTGIGRQSARARIARLLLELFMRYWATWPGKGVEAMHLPLTQEHLADAAGLSGIHVNRVLRRLQREGIVEFHYRRLLVMNPDGLVEAAELDPDLAKSWLRQIPSK